MRRRRDEGGAVAVELALVLPFLLVIVTGVVDFGLAFMLKAQAQEGAEEAAIHAARYPSQQADAKQHALDAVSYTDLDPSEVTITCTGSGTGVGRRVTVTIDHDYDSPFGFIVDDFDVHATITSEVLSDEECP